MQTRKPGEGDLRRVAESSLLRDVERYSSASFGQRAEEHKEAEQEACGLHLHS